MNQFTATVLGAFLASIFGLIGSLVLWHYQNKKEKKTIIKMLYSELTNLKSLVLRLQTSIEQGIVQPGVRLQITFLKYNTFSLERQKLYSFISHEEMNILENVFNNFEQYDQLLREIPTQAEGENLDSIMIFWSFYQTQYKENFKNIDHCIQYLKKIS